MLQLECSTQMQSEGEKPQLDAMVGTQGIRGQKRKAQEADRREVEGRSKSNAEAELG